MDSSSTSYVILALVSMLAGGVASLSGFGIGSLLTPVFASLTNVQIAVAAVAIPHFVGTVLRCWLLRKHIHPTVFKTFGITSAIGGLIGALLHTIFSDPMLAITFGALLTFVGTTGLLGINDRLRFGKNQAWAAGTISGILGGLVGNQGGIRSAGLMGFELTKEEFVATATAVGVIVDLVRMPVYMVANGSDLIPFSIPIAIAAVAVVVGTFAGKSTLSKLPEPVFKKTLSVLILALGVYMLLFGR